MTAPVAGLITTTFDGGTVEGDVRGGAGEACPFAGEVAECTMPVPGPPPQSTKTTPTTRQPTARGATRAVPISLWRRR